MQKSYFCMEQKYKIMKGSKGSETKMTIREEAFKLFLTKDFNIVPLKQIERSFEFIKRLYVVPLPNETGAVQ